MVLNNKQSALYVIGFVFIIVSMTIVYYLTSKPSEHFSNGALTTYNNLMNNSSCERDFRTYIELDGANLSERALQAKESPGNCKVNIRSPKHSEDASFIVENHIKYALTSVCVSLRYTEIHTSDNDRIVTVKFAKTNKDDYINLMYLFMGNPVYIEFEDSVPYVPMYTNSNNTLSNINDKETSITCSFRRLVGPNQEPNTLFKFNNAKNLRDIFKDIINKQSNVEKLVNSRVYLLDKESAQTTSVQLNLQNVYSTNPIIGTIKLYKKNYSTTENPKSDVFFFHQRIYTMMQNGDLPVFTFGFNILSSDSIQKELSQAVEIFKVYMPHKSIGKHAETCMPDMRMLETTNVNILSCIVSMTSEEKKRGVYVFRASTGSRSGNTCTLSSDDTITVTLPLLGGISTVSVVLTVSPVEKIALFKWKDETGHDKFIFTRSQKCNKNNFFNQLFTQRQSGSVESNDIDMLYHSTFVTKLKFAELGHRHYVNSYLEN